MLEDEVMNLRLMQAIQMLDDDGIDAGNKLDEYRNIQNDLSSESAQELQYVIEHFLILQQSILKASLALKAESTKIN